MTAIVIPTTIMLTMFAANVMGFTINRVSLFALIFSIGILVDDAIVDDREHRPALGHERRSPRLHDGDRSRGRSRQPDRSSPR